MPTQKNSPETTTVKSHTASLCEAAISVVRSFYSGKQDPFSIFDTLLERFELGFYLLLNKIGVTFITTDILDELMEFHFHYGCKRTAVETFNTALNEPAKLDEIYKMLADPESKQIFDWLIQYRTAYALGSDSIATALFPLNGQALTGEKSLAQTLRDNFLMKTYKIKGYAIKSHGEIIRETWDNETYFLKDRCQVREGDTIIDAGAFCGESAIWFADKAGKSGRVFTFEPSAEFAPIILKNIHRNGMDSVIELVPKGIWDENKDIYLSNLAAESTSKEAAATAETTPAKLTAQKIEVVTLDSFVDWRGLERVDFIKMDIEGAEMRALRGAEKIIKKFKPRLAICIYHLPTDLYEIPLFLKSIVPEYDLYLSQKSTSPDGTVLFANVKGK